MKIYMLCGQSGSGKSTFGMKLQEELPNCAFIRIDDIPLELEPIERYYRYINKFVESIKSKQYDTIILDHHHSLRIMREEILDKIPIDCGEIELIVISLRPGTNNIISWRKTSSEPIINAVKHLYESYEMPTDEEFNKYGFKSVSNIVINNSIL